MHRGGGGNRTRVLRLLIGPSPSAAGRGLSGAPLLPAATAPRIRRRVLSGRSERPRSKPCLMTPVNQPAGLRLGVCFVFRLFYVAPETTARFSQLDDRSRNRSPPWMISSPAFRPARTLYRSGSPPAPATAIGTDPARPSADRSPALGVPDGSRGFALGFTRKDRLALVVQPAAAYEGELDLGLAVAEVQGERDHRERLLLAPAHELVDLLAVDEELALPVGVVGSPAGRELPLRDMDAEEPELAVLHAGVCVGELRLAVAERLHLTASQHDPGLERLEDVVVVTGATVGGDGPVARAPFALCGTLGRHLLRSRHEATRLRRVRRTRASSPARVAARAGSSSDRPTPR